MTGGSGPRYACRKCGGEPVEGHEVDIDPVQFGLVEAKGDDPLDMGCYKALVNIDTDYMGIYLPGYIEGGYPKTTWLCHDCFARYVCSLMGAQPCQSNAEQTITIRP